MQCVRILSDVCFGHISEEGLKYRADIQDLLFWEIDEHIRVRMRRTKVKHLDIPILKIKSIRVTTCRRGQSQARITGLVLLRSLDGRIPGVCEHVTGNLRSDSVSTNTLPLGIATRPLRIGRRVDDFSDGQSRQFSAARYSPVAIVVVGQDVIEPHCRGHDQLRPDWLGSRGQLGVLATTCSPVGDP